MLLAVLYDELTSDPTGWADIDYAYEEITRYVAFVGGEKWTDDITDYVHDEVDSYYRDAPDVETFVLWCRDFFGYLATETTVTPGAAELAETCNYALQAIGSAEAYDEQSSPWYQFIGAVAETAEEIPEVVPKIGKGIGVLLAGAAALLFAVKS